jgi:hypothetical protein
MIDPLPPVPTDLDYEANCLLDKALRLSYRNAESHEQELAIASLITAYVQLATFLRREAAAQRTNPEHGA